MILYMCVAFIWVIVGMYAIPCRKELDRLYDLEEDTYMTNIQSEKMDWIMEHKSIPENMLQPIQPFDEYKAELIEEQNKNLFRYIRNGIIASVVYIILMSLIIVDCNKMLTTTKPTTYIVDN